METMTINPIEQFLSSLEASAEKCLVNNKLEFLNKLENIGFPTTKTEAWKYTRTTKISKQNFKFCKTAINSAEPFKIQEMSAHTLVFVNGFFAPEHSNYSEKEGIRITPFSLAKESELTQLNTQQLITEDVFSLINAAFANDGVLVHLAKNKQLALPVQIIHISTGENNTTQNRNLFILEEGAKAEIIQTFYTENANHNFTYIQNNSVVNKNASLTIEKIQNESGENFIINRDQATQGRDSVFTVNTNTLSGFLVRNDLYINVIGENATTHLNGTYLTKGKQHIDNHTFVDHKVANCESFELYKGVMDEQSTAVFNGKVLVRKDAQRINAYQSNGNVLLSENASVNSKPELEIYADDVKCSHGSTTGQLDDEAIYYLQTRGISKKGAKQLLVAAFIGEVLNKIENEKVRNHIDTVLLERFGWTF